MCGDPVQSFSDAFGRLAHGVGQIGAGAERLRSKGTQLVESFGKHPPALVPIDYTAEAAAADAKVQADATATANQQLLADARRKRAQKGLLPSDNVLASGVTPVSSTVLGSGGA